MSPLMMKKAEIVLASLLLLATLNSSYYFLSVMRVRAVEWIAFNACAVSNLVFLAGFVLYLFNGDRRLIFVALLPMFFFGGLGLFLFPWSGFNLIAQAGHLIMVLNIAAAVLAMTRQGDYRSAATGMLLGIVIFSSFIGWQQAYTHMHANDAKRVLGVDVGAFASKLDAGS